MKVYQGKGADQERERATAGVCFCGLVENMGNLLVIVYDAVSMSYISAAFFV